MEEFTYSMKKSAEELPNLSMDELVALREHYIRKSFYITITEELNKRVRKELGEGYDIDWLLNQEAGMPS